MAMAWGWGWSPDSIMLSWADEAALSVEHSAQEARRSNTISQHLVVHGTGKLFQMTLMGIWLAHGMGLGEVYMEAMELGVCVLLTGPLG